MALAVRQDEPISFRQPITVPEHPLTWDDVQELPDDGRRYELVDGVLLVSPAPVTVHQRALLRVASLLIPACGSDEEVFVAPYAWYVSQYTVFEPDVLVVQREDLTKRRLEGTPLLAVEVLSPSTQYRDLGLKLRAYENAGLAWYWVIDPYAPRLTAFKLVDERYVQNAVVAGDQSYEATEPVAVTVMPSALAS